VPCEDEATVEERFGRPLGCNEWVGYRLSSDTLMIQSLSRTRALTCAELP